MEWPAVLGADPDARTRCPHRLPPRSCCNSGSVGVARHGKLPPHIASDENVTEADPHFFLDPTCRSPSKPLAKRASHSAVASERLAVIRRRHLSGPGHQVRTVGRCLTWSPRC